MTVQGVLNKKGSEVVSVGGSETVLAASRLMNERGIGGLVVVDGTWLIGIFTERDILRRVVAAQRDPAHTQVREVMTTPVACCRPDTTLEECRSVMTGKRVRHIPVVNDKGLCGIVTSGDLLAWEVTEQASTIQYLSDYIYGGR